MRSLQNEGFLVKFYGGTNTVVTGDTTVYEEKVSKETNS